jgi:hypothetical protein
VLKVFGYLAVFLLAVVGDLATFDAAGFGVEAFLTAGALSRLGAVTDLMAALTNSIFVPGVVSTTTDESLIDTILPVIPPSMTTFAPTFTELVS